MAQALTADAQTFTAYNHYYGRYEVDIYGSDA